MNAIKVAALVAAPVIALTACGGGSSLSDRQIADKFADHSACKDYAQYFQFKTSLENVVTCDPENEFSKDTFTFCRASVGVNGSDTETAYYYQNASGHPIQITIDNHLVQHVEDTLGAEYGYCK